MSRINKPWWVTRRHERGGCNYIQNTKVETYAQAVEVARKWYTMHGINYGILIRYHVPEINELVTVRDFYLINCIEDIL